MVRLPQPPSMSAPTEAPSRQVNEEVSQAYLRLVLATVALGVILYLMATSGGEDHGYTASLFFLVPYQTIGIGWIFWVKRQPDQNHWRRYLSLAADLGHTMLFAALASGRTLHLLPQDYAFDPDRLARYMSEHRVGALKLVPSHLQSLLQAGNPADVLPQHALVLGGETCPWSLVEQVQRPAPYQRRRGHHLGIKERLAAQLAMQVAAMAVGPVHHRGYREAGGVADTGAHGVLPESCERGSAARGRLLLRDPPGYGGRAAVRRAL